MLRLNNVRPRLPLVSVEFDPSAFAVSSLTRDGKLSYRQLTMKVSRGTADETLCCPPEKPQPEVSLVTLEGPEADEELAKLAKAIGHPARVRILRLLSRKEARVCSQIVDKLPLAQSTVSEHLRILKDAGLVRSSQDGLRVGYCIDFDGLRRLKAFVAII